jgi:hypothetical protein
LHEPEASCHYRHGIKVPNCITAAVLPDRPPSPMDPVKAFSMLHHEMNEMDLSIFNGLGFLVQADLEFSNILQILEFNSSHVFQLVKSCICFLKIISLNFINIYKF